MSKGTIRLPASAVTGNRVGTARIREQIAGAARELADSTPTPLDATMRSLAGAIAIPTARVAAEWRDAFRSETPVERMQELGRQPRGKMNKTEAAYAQLLDARRAAGEICEFKFESVKLRLADRTWYMPDFSIYLPDGSMEFHEVKGFMTEDANVKLKVAAETFRPHLFRLVRKGKKGTWTITIVSAR